MKTEIDATLARVSIVIPCYKQAHWLPQAVQSCIEQTYDNIEIIVVDDGSPDDVSGALRPFSSQVKVVTQKNQGLGAARNAGIKVATGEYIKFLDADDWLLPHCVEMQIQALCNLQNHVAIIGYRLYFQDCVRGDEDVFPDFGNLQHALCYINTEPLHTFLYAMQDIKRLQGFVNHLPAHEDYELICRLAANNIKTVVLHSIGCVYRQVPFSMSKNLANMQSSRRLVWTEYIDRLLKKKCTPQLLVDILGGYGRRLSMGDFRYEFIGIIHQVYQKLSAMRSCIPQAALVLLAHKLAYILRNLPTANGWPEHCQQQKCRQLVRQLAAIVIERITAQHVMQENPHKALLDLADAHLWSRQNRYCRKILRHALAIAPEQSRYKFGCRVLLCLSYIFPGKTASGIWKFVANFRDGYPVRQARA